MTAGVVAVPPTLPLTELEDVLIARHIGGAPVVEDGRLVGIVSRSDVVRYFSIRRALLPIAGRHPPGAQEDAHLTVRDVMTRDPVVVGPDAAVEQSITYQPHSRTTIGSTRRTAMNSDPTTSSLSALSQDECLALLKRGSVGRLAVTIDDRPHILPLNYAVDPTGVIVFRTAELTTAGGAALAHLAFEVDEIDFTHHTGKSVVVHGLGREITHAVDSDSERLLRMPVRSWAAGQRDRWFKITPSEITGRQLGPPV
jgi:CBS domain-containing protein